MNESQVRPVHVDPVKDLPNGSISHEIPSISLPQAVKAGLPQAGARALDALGREALSARGSSPAIRAESFRQFAPAEMMTFAADVADQLNEDFGALVIAGFPISDDEDLTAMCLLIFCAGLGVPLPNNRDGILAWPIIAEQVTSTKDMAGNTRDGNTGSRLLYHTDPCSIAGLLCVLPADTGGANLFVSVQTVHDRIAAERPDLLAELYKPVFIDRKGEEQEGAPKYATIPVFARQDGMLQCHWTRTYTVNAYKRYDVPPLSPKQEEALRFLEKTINLVGDEVEYSGLAGEGDLVLVSNNKVYHSRKPFEGNRKLLRVWIENEKYPGLPHTFGYEPDSTAWPN